MQTIGTTNGSEGLNREKAFVTEVVNNENDFDEVDDGMESEDDEERNNQIFTVREAIPPTDYDAPYSQLPGSVVLKRVKEKVKASYMKMAKQKVKEQSMLKNKQTQRAGSQSILVGSRGAKRNPDNQDLADGQLPPIKGGMQVAKPPKKPREKKAHWLDLLDFEHADAVISDAFWYVICKICNPKPEFMQHQEFLLDRIAANFVSFTLIEDPRFDKEGQEQFFKKFYDIISQAVYYSMYYAYPKSRKTLDENFMRQLTNTFSDLFTGSQIHSASLSHWDQGFVQKAHVGAKNKKDASLADCDINQRTKSVREEAKMRYSPLVERYLISHNYETINNVRKWNMLLTKRNEIQKDVDKKFRKFKQISDQAIQQKDKWNKEYQLRCEEADRKNEKNKKECNKHIEMLKALLVDKKENGSCSEFANMVTSQHQYKQCNAAGDD